MTPNKENQESHSEGVKLLNVTLSNESILIYYPSSNNTRG